MSATAAKSRQSCPTLCDPIDGSPPGSSVPGILQARTLEWVASAFSVLWVTLLILKICLILKFLLSPYIILSLLGSHLSAIPLFFFYLFFFQLQFYFIFKLYKIVLVLPNIKMNPPQVYMCSPSWTLLPPSIFPSIRVFSNESALGIRWPLQH